MVMRICGGVTGLWGLSSLLPTGHQFCRSCALLSSRYLHSTVSWWNNISTYILAELATTMARHNYLYLHEGLWKWRERGLTKANLTQNLLKLFWLLLYRIMTASKQLRVQRFWTLSAYSARALSSKILVKAESSCFLQ